jgi:hypothetical protein
VKPIRRQFSVSDGVLDVAAFEIGLNCAGIVSSVGQHAAVAAGMARADSAVAPGESLMAGEN